VYYCVLQRAAVWIESSMKHARSHIAPRLCMLIKKVPPALFLPVFFFLWAVCLRLRAEPIVGHFGESTVERQCRLSNQGISSCMYTYVYFMYIYICTYVHIYIYTYIHVCIDVPSQPRYFFVYLHICVYMHCTCVCLCTYIHMYTRIYIYMYSCMHRCIGVNYEYRYSLIWQRRGIKSRNKALPHRVAQTRRILILQAIF